MNPEDLLRMIDIIHREKDIPKDVIFRALEDALAAGVRKRLGVGEDLVVHIDRKSGEVKMEDDEEEYEIDLAELGRIAAQAVKQGFQQRLREAERDVLFEEYEARVGQLVNGVVQRYEGDSLVVNLGRVEAVLGKEDRVRGENFNPGDRIRAIIVEVRKDGSRVRTHSFAKGSPVPAILSPDASVGFAADKDGNLIEISLAPPAAPATPTAPGAPTPPK